MNKFERENLTIYFKTCENMEEIADKSVDLFISGSLYLGKEWKPYKELFTNLYIYQAQRVLKDNGFLVIQQTDGYNNNIVFNKSRYLLELLDDISIHLKLIDVKIWKRCNINFFQSPFSYFYIFTKSYSKIGRMNIKNKDYMPGIWDYPQLKGSELNAWNLNHCKMMINSFTKEGDTILDPLCGLANLLILGSKMNRKCIGYEIDPTFKAIIEEEYKNV